MNKLFKTSILLLVAGFIFVSTPSNAVESNVVYSANTEVQLISNLNSLSSDSKKEVAIAFRMKIDPQWHVYWKNPGDSGIPPKVEWQLPERFVVSEPIWPIPERIAIEPLVSYGYEGEVYLVYIIRFSDIQSQNITIAANAKWLACKIQCVPGEADLSLTIPIKDQVESNEHFPQFIKDIKIPSRWKNIKQAAYESDDYFVLSIEYPNKIAPNMALIENVEFFPYESDVINHALKQQVTIQSNGFDLKIQKSILWDEREDKSYLSGILVFNHDRADIFEAYLQEHRTVSAIPKQNFSFLTAILFAFLGGLILNLMPCVLPILSIKILSLVDHAKEEKGETVKHGLLFSAGVVAMFWVLAGLMIALKLAGKKIGWGFQFQSPLFLLVMSGLFIYFAMSMFGMFEIGSSLTRLGGIGAGKIRYRNSFLNGLLATIVATPCTAPFMGSALGYAVTQPAAVSFGVFTFLGLGMAFPFLVFSIFPQALKFLPKPGPWMINLKRFFGVLFLLTAFWLGWVLLSQHDTAQVKIQSENQIQWQNYSQELMGQLQSEGKLIFLDFTAKWCLSCQVNERVALNNPEVIREFKKQGIVGVKADWTNYDERITYALEQFGKNSIPLYVLYPGDPSVAPVILPEILTPGIVLNILRENFVQ